MLVLLAHPFSSYCWKVQIALYENGTPYEYKLLGPDQPENQAALAGVSPHGKFPVLVDGEQAVFESTIIIEYLQQFHPGRAVFIPTDPVAALEVRKLDRFFDNYVMTPMQRIVGDFIREPAQRDALTVTEAKAMLLRSYTWLEAYLVGREFASGKAFSLVDCAAAPSLFYADWVCEIGEEFPLLKGYRQRLLARDSVVESVDKARPFRSHFPAGAPDRD
jgi:glutathione S-transferase